MEEHADRFSSIHLLPKTNTISKNGEFDYFSIAPDETLYFTFDFICEAPGIYNIEFRIPFVYQGKSGEYKYLDSHSILCPKAFSVYDYLVDGASQRLPSPPNSSFFDIEGHPLPDNKEIGKLTKVGEYHITNNGNFMESLDWLPKNKIPALPFWQMTLYNNRDFKGTPSYIGNIKIESSYLNTYLFKFISDDLKDGIIPSHENYSLVLKSEQHFFGGEYEVCTHNTLYSNNDNDNLTGPTLGTIEVAIDDKPIISFSDTNIEECIGTFQTTNGNHIVSIKFLKNDPSTQDVNFSVNFSENISYNQEIKVEKTKTPIPTFTPTSTNECKINSNLDLKIGDFVKVSTTDGITLSLRDDPNIYARIVEKLKAGIILEIIGGPVCENNYRWWKVKFKANDKYIIGWVADGDSNENFLKK